MTDATGTTGTSKPQNEVVEETRETLAVLEQTRMPRPEKMAAERKLFDGAHEVRFSERTFRPRHDASIDDVRAFVDSLVVERREVAPLPTIAPPEPVVVEQRIPDHYRLALEPVIHGSLVKVETVHRVGTGTVVDVEWEGRDEATHKGLYIIEDGVARKYENLAQAVDELPAPSLGEPASPAAAPSAPTSRAPDPAPAPAPVEEKKRFGFGKKDKAKPPEPEAAEPAAEEPKKKRFGFGRK